METMTHAFQTGYINHADVNALSIQLDHLQSAYEETLQKSAVLSAEITTFEARRQYLDSAMEEGQRIAAETMRNAELRVENIIAGSNRILLPQKKLIARIEMEINELSQTLESLSATNAKPACMQSEPYPDNLGFLVNKPRPEMIAGTSLSYFTETTDFNHKYAAESLAQKPSAEVLPAEACLPDSEAFMGVSSDHQPEALLEETWTAEESAVYRAETGASNASTVEQPSAEERSGEFLYKEMASEMAELPVLSGEMLMEESLESLAVGEETADRQIDLSEPVIAVEEYDLADEAEFGEQSMTFPESSRDSSDKSILQLDVLLRCCFYINKGSNSEYLYDHEWQIRIDARIPEDNYEFVRYGKDPQTIKATLLRYDGVMLNDVYPFDIIAPDLSNIGHYFYNILDDNLSLMNLHLTEVSIWKNEVLILRVNTRDRDLDALLQGGDDILEDLRGKFYSQ